MQTTPQIQPGSNSPTVTSISPRKLSSSSGKIKLIAQVVAISSNLALLIGLIVVIAHLGKKKEDDVELTKGPRGRIGYVGKMGPKGDKGPDGDQGPRGPIGPSPVPVAIGRADLTEVFQNFTSNFKDEPIYGLLDGWDDNSHGIPANHLELLEMDWYLKGETTKADNQMRDLREKLIRIQDEDLNDSELAELIQQQTYIDTKIKASIDILTYYFSKHQKPVIPHILFSDYFFGRYFKNKDLLMKKIEDGYSKRITEEQNGVLFGNYHENYEIIKRFALHITKNLFFDYQEEEGEKISIESLNILQIGQIMYLLNSNHFHALIGYDYFCYYFLFTKLERKGKYSIMKVRQHFDDLFKLVSIPNWDEHLEKVKGYIKEFYKYRKLAQNEKNRSKKLDYEYNERLNRKGAISSLELTQELMLHKKEK